nr:odorant-binding protein [Lasioderma serricorne]
MCCAKDEIHGLMTKNREAKKACFDEFMGDLRGLPPDAFQCENVMELKKRAICVGQCYAQKLGIIDSQGDVNKDGLKDFLKENLKMDWFEPLIEEVAEKCSAEANGEQDEEAMCKPNGMKLMHCIFTEVQLRCPDNEIEDKEMCSKLRNFIIPHMKTD